MTRMLSKKVRRALDLAAHLDGEHCRASREATEAVWQAVVRIIAELDAADRERLLRTAQVRRLDTFFRWFKR